MSLKKEMKHTGSLCRARVFQAISRSFEVANGDPGISNKQITAVQFSVLTEPKTESRLLSYAADADASTFQSESRIWIRFNG